MQITDNILDLIGNTPLIRISRLDIPDGVTLLGKMEYLNPGGSVKDRIGPALLDEAERSGRLKPGGTIVEATSGNTGIALALAAVRKGYKAIFVLPDKMSLEKVHYMEALGARVIMVRSDVDADHPEYYTNVGKRLSEEIDNAIFVDQFYNMANPEAHYRTTGPELWDQTDGRITHLVGGMGTGGTMSGSGRFLKEKNPAVRIIGADPLGSTLKPFKDTGELGSREPYLVEGIGQEKIPGTLDMDILDEIITITDDVAFATSRELARKEGIFVGGSTGLNVAAALQVAQTAPSGSVIVAILCDTGERYLSKVHNPQWLIDNHVLHRADATAGMLVRTRPKESRQPILVPADCPAKEAAQTASLHGASVVFVEGGDVPAGLISTRTLMARGESDISADRLMQPLTIVPGSMPLLELIPLLDQADAVLVREYGITEGYLEPSDLLKL